MQELSAPDVKIQSFLSQRCRREHMWPKRRIKRAAQIISAKAIFTASCAIFDFGIREWHRRMATQRISLVARAGFVNTMAAPTQPEHTAQIARKARDGVSIELTRNPEVFIEYGFEIACDNGFRNCLGVRLRPAGECSVKERRVQVGTQSVPTCFQEVPVALVGDAA
jgi:hypothetical protein